MASVHPESLRNFELGWEMLPEESRNLWLEQGRHLKTYPAEWGSWEMVRYEQYQEAHTATFDPSDLLSSISEAIQEHMPHSGAIYDIPEMPSIGQSVKTEGGHSSEEDDTDDEESNADYGMKEAIAEQAAEAILNAELPKLVQLIRRELKEKGLDAVHRWYPPQL
jgi:hypothetical protein